MTADFERKLPELETYLECLIADGGDERGWIDRQWTLLPESIPPAIDPGKASLSLEVVAELHLSKR